MAQPFTGEIYLSLPGEAHYHRGAERLQLRTSEVTELARAKLTTTSPEMFEQHGSDLSAQWDGDPQQRRSRRATGSTATAIACWPPATSTSWSKPASRTSTSRPLIPIIENAGGVVTTWDGGPAEDGGNVVAAATPELHAAALAVLNGVK